MSVSMYQSRVNQLRTSVASLRKKLAQEKDKEARKSKDLTDTTRSLAKTKSASTVKTKQNKANRLMGELAKIEKSIADLEGKIASKAKELHNAEQKLGTALDKQDSARRADELKHEKALTQEVRKRKDLEALQNRLIAEFPDYEAPPEDVKYDIFISHAWQDKEGFVEPLAELLSNMGLKVWYDDFVLTVGDSLRQSIDRGIANAEYGLVVLSPHFFAKGWTNRELDGLTAREVAGRRKLILPIWHNVSHEDVLEYSPMLADKIALDTGKMSLEEIAEAIAEVLPGSNYEEEDGLRGAEAERENTLE
jgi:hypothetical protein